jgi:phytoene/squalene synthetase
VGRLLLHLYRVGDALSLRQSDAICSALQLINFWQDLSVDLPRGRVYVPLDALQRHRLELRQLLQGEDSSAARTLVRELTDWAGALMTEGAPLALRLPGLAGWELRLVVQGGCRILEKIAAMDYASLRSRPVLRRSDAPRLLWRALRMTR